jgi:membrane protein
MLGNIYRDFERYDYYTLAAALAFFFMLALFPLLIFLGSAIAYIPEPRLFEHILKLMAPFVPRQAMGIVSRVVSDILNTNRGLLSLGILGAVWIASGGFSALIAALNIAYDVPEARPFWKRRLVAFALTFLTGTLVALALLALVLGPRFGLWLTSQVGMDPLFAMAWPYIRWTAILLFSVLSMELIYYVGPNRPQRFAQQLPGAALAVALWILSSNTIGWYFRTFPEFNRTYGALGAMIALMLWFYVTAVAILLGAELNAELLKSRLLSAARKVLTPEDESAAERRNG